MQASTDELQELALMWLHPISEEKPAGAIAKYEPAYEAVVSEVSKLDSVTGGEVDWPKVVRLGGEVLQDVSKDLIMACNVAYGLRSTEGLMGCVRGLVLVSGLMESYWTTMFPPVKRLRGRIGTLSWLVGRLEADLEGFEPSESDREAVGQLDLAARKLDSLIKTCLDGEGPSLRPLRRNIDRLVMTLPKVAESAQQEQAPPVAAAPVAPVAEVNSPQPAAEFVQSTNDDQGVVQEQITGDTEKTEILGAAKADVASPKEPQLRELVEEFLAPISEEQPSGVAAKYEPAYEWITTEIAKLDALTGGVVDWAKLGVHAQTILTTMSKDMVIAVYAVISWHETEGLAGLVRGMTLVSELMDGFWDSMFPPIRRIRARAGSLEWLVTRLETTLADVVPTDSDRIHVEALGQSAKRLETVIRDKFEGEGPSLRSLVRTLERMQMSLPEPSVEVASPQPVPVSEPIAKPERAVAPVVAATSKESSSPELAVKAPAPAPVTVAVAKSSVSAESLGSAPKAFEEGQDIGKYLAQVGKTLTATAKLIRQADATSPTPYRLARLGAWLHLSSAPPADAQGKTKIPPPQAALAGRLEKMAANGKWQAVLEETESTLTQYRFWLDLHRFAAQALMSQGPSHAAAYAAVLAQVATFLLRVPGVVDMSFADGTPFADSATKEWITSEVMPSEASSPSSDMDEASADLLSEATSLAKGSKLADALSLLADESEKTANHQQRFRLRLFMAKMASNAGQSRVARGIYESLYAEVEKRDLEQWDPPLAIECLHGYLMVARKLSKSDAGKSLSSDAEISNILFNKLCVLAPSMAMALDS